MVRKSVLALALAVLLSTSACLFNFPFDGEIRERKNVSNLTLVGDFLYFGSGYHVYRLNLKNQLLEKIFTPDRILVEQPLVSNGLLYFGGRSVIDKYGNRGELQGFFAVDLESRKVKWKFPLGVKGYGTYGTFPVLANDRILVSAREHLHCLDRMSGKELWRIDNWMGRVSDSVTFPYVYKDYCYFKISEQHVANSQKSNADDGHWAEVNLESGARGIIRVAQHPGTWNYSSGHGFGALVDGVIYGKTRIDYFGALDLNTRKILWEVEGNNYPLPAINEDFVFTVRQYEIQALNRKTGTTAWRVPLGELADLSVERSKNRPRHDYEHFWSRRFAIGNDILVVQGSQGILALKASNGEKLWFVKSESEASSVNPVVVQQTVIAVSDKDCSLLALDLKTGKELWRVQIPDCTTYYWLDD